VAAWLSMLALSFVAAIQARVSILKPLQALLLPAAGAGAMLGLGYFWHLDATYAFRLLVVPPVLLLVYLCVVAALGFATNARAAAHVRRAISRPG